MKTIEFSLQTAIKGADSILDNRFFSSSMEQTSSNSFDFPQFENEEEEEEYISELEDHLISFGISEYTIN